MDAFLISTATVTLAEIGDKTQLLSLFLVAHFHRRAPIIAAILVATLANHFLSAWFGVWLADLFQTSLVQQIISASFILLGLWLLIPDKDDGSSTKFDRYGVFFASLILFFLAEIGDKTQVATVLLAGQFKDLLWVTLGTTTGMLLANVPVVLAGKALLNQIPFAKVRLLAALFAIGFGLFGFIAG